MQMLLTFCNELVVRKACDGRHSKVSRAAPYMFVVGNPPEAQSVHSDATAGSLACLRG